MSEQLKTLIQQTIMGMIDESVSDRNIQTLSSTLSI